MATASSPVLGTQAFESVYSFESTGIAAAIVGWLNGGSVRVLDGAAVDVSITGMKAGGS
jgi:hypothetical protein